MGYSEWLQEFIFYLKEYSVNPSEIDEVVTAMDSEIKITHERGVDPEIACIRIGKEFFKAKKEVEMKETFEHYSTHHPKLYSVKHCLDAVFARMECLDTYLKLLRSGSTEPNGSNHQISRGLKICEERFSGDISLLPDSDFSSLAGILIMRINTTEDKILLVSTLRSKYSVLCEVLSVMSRIPVLVLETGIPDEMNQERWDALTIAIDEIKDSEFFLMDYSEPIVLEELIEDLKKAQRKGGFDVIIISGLTHLN